MKMMKLSAFQNVTKGSGINKSDRIEWHQIECKIVKFSTPSKIRHHLIMDLLIYYCQQSFTSMGLLQLMQLTDALFINLTSEIEIEVEIELES